MKNDFRSCSACGKIFIYRGDNKCPDCAKELEEQFDTIKKYLYKHPGAGVAEVAEETEIDEKTILYFLREGRLELASADSSLTCMNCGEAIKSGKYCKKCSTQLSSTLDSVVKKPEPEPILGKDKSKLHIEVKRR